jgi:uncharacterized protein DUF4915
VVSGSVSLSIEEPEVVTDSATHILVSFCNVTTGAPSLAIVDIDGGGVQVLRVPVALAAEDARGIALSDRYVFVTTGRPRSKGRAARDSAGRSHLFVLGRHDLALVSSHVCEHVVDAHSLRAAEDHVDIVSTGSDEVVRLRLSGPHVIAEEVVWRPDPAGPRADIHHLNAICSWRGDVAVSGFGRKADRLWSSAADGFIACVGSGERFATGIGQPHSVVDLDGTLAYCESSTGTIRLLGREEVGQVPGYARGICRVGDRLFVGTSKGRHVSKSSGVLTNRADPGTPAGHCSLVRLRIDTLTTEQVIDLDLLSWEIYDLLAVSSVELWPVLDEIEWRDSFIVGVRADYEERDQVLSWLHTEVGARDSEVTRLHEEVAERDRIVEWLHGEVAERDRIVKSLQREVAERDSVIEELRASKRRRTPE